MNIEVVIDELVVEGPSRLDGAALRRGVVTELTRLLEVDPAALTIGLRSDEIPATIENLDEPLSDNIQDLGRQIASAIYRSITT
jgi:hypothetical protein